LGLKKNQSLDGETLDKFNHDLVGFGAIKNWESFLFEKTISSLPENVVFANKVKRARTE